MIAWDHWHIELSSICALKCPRCPRAEVPESLLNRQLSLNFFQEQIGAKHIKQMRRITFCGNDGDPIYCREFLEICQWIKTNNPTLQLVIITNGSYKSTEWWQQLANILNQHDEIHWSIDGWDHASNQQYRVNSDWDSIEQGIQTFVAHNSSTYRVCASIAFKFNQDHLTHMLNRARLTGMDLWQLTLSTKFGSRYPDAYGRNDSLEPTVNHLVSSSGRFQRNNYQLSARPRPSDQLRPIYIQRRDSIQNYSAICMIGNKGVFLNSQGEFYPCCWVANRYPHNNNWISRAQTQFNLHQKTLDEIIADPFWSSDEFLSFNSLECTTKCTADRWGDPMHVSEW